MQLHGGGVYHDLGRQFLTPTINLFISSPDFVKFCLNLHQYMNYELEEIPSTEKYPIAKLGDIKLYLVHYKNFNEAKTAWDRRKARIVWDNIFVLMTDRDEFTDDLLDDFNRIPYPKVLFSHKYIENDNVVWMKKFKHRNEVDVLGKYYNWSGEKNYEHYFDILKWLTGNYSTAECRKNQ